MNPLAKQAADTFDVGALAEVATKAIYTHGFGFRAVYGPSLQDGKYYVNFAWNDDSLVRAIFWISPREEPDASDLSGGEATGEQSACPASDAAKVSPEFRADPSFTYLLTDNLVEANKEILRLRDALEATKALATLDIGLAQARAEKAEAALAEAAAYLNALGDNLLRNDADMLLDECEDPKDVATRLTRQEGSEEGDRLGRLKVGAGCEQPPETSSQEGGE